MVVTPHGFEPHTTQINFIQPHRQEIAMDYDAWSIAYVVLFLILYITLNVVGTIYYQKLKPGTSTRSVGLLTVIVGWLGFPVLNIYSPIAHDWEP